jgi:hypothetical protein
MKSTISLKVEYRYAIPDQYWYWVVSFSQKITTIATSKYHTNSPNIYTSLVFNQKNSWATYQDLAGTKSLKNLETQTRKVCLEYVAHSTLVNIT